MFAAEGLVREPEDETTSLDFAIVLLCVALTAGFVDLAPVGFGAFEAVIGWTRQTRANMPLTRNIAW